MRLSCERVTLSTATNPAVGASSWNATPCNEAQLFESLDLGGIWSSFQSILKTWKPFANAYKHNQTHHASSLHFSWCIHRKRLILLLSVTIVIVSSLVITISRSWEFQVDCPMTSHGSLLTCMNKETWLMTPCRTEKVDFSKKIIKNRITKKTNRQEESPEETRKKQKKQKLRKMHGLIFFLICFCFFLVFSLVLVF